MSYIKPSSVPSVPGDPYIPAAERAFHMGMSTHSYLRELRAAGIDPIRMAGAIHVRDSEHAALMQRLQERHQHAAPAAPAQSVQPKLPQALPSVEPALADRLNRQEAELEALRRQIEHLLASNQAGGTQQ